MPGFTAFMGLLDIGRPVVGETVVVAAASGAVGSVVGEIAKIKGCTVVGIAGGANKCRYVVDELGFDGCVDHRADGLSERLAAVCPKGIDLYRPPPGPRAHGAPLENGYQNTQQPPGPRAHPAGPGARPKARASRQPSTPPRGTVL